MKQWGHYNAPHVAHVRTPKGYLNPSGALLSPKQFHQKGKVNFRRTTQLGNTSITISRNGLSVSTHVGHGLPSFSTSRRGTRSNIALGQGFFYRKTSGKQSR